VVELRIQQLLLEDTKTIPKQPSPLPQNREQCSMQSAMSLVVMGCGNASIPSLTYEEPSYQVCDIPLKGLFLLHWIFVKFRPLPEVNSSTHVEEARPNKDCTNTVPCQSPMLVRYIEQNDSRGVANVLLAQRSAIRLPPFESPIMAVPGLADGGMKILN
jgi:hypothetical protein